MQKIYYFAKYDDEFFKLFLVNEKHSLDTNFRKKLKICVKTKHNYFFINLEMDVGSIQPHIQLLLILRFCKSGGILQAW